MEKPIKHNCNISTEQIRDLTQEIWERAEERVGPILFRQAWLEFCAWFPKEFPKDPSVDRLFVPWLLFVWDREKKSAHKPRTLAREYLLERTKHPIYHLICEGAVPHVGIFRLEKKAEAFLVEDLVVGGLFEVNDFSASLEPGDIVVGVKAANGCCQYLLGCSHPIALDAKDEILALQSWLSAHGKKDGEYLPEVSTEIFEIYERYKKTDSSRSS